ncbi:unnamed protein product [Gulo gulo]|uniref:Uncharacterized protein n=1 Tax=Gulo gulo TaxID=48420 RepID=A0A9X9LYS4_GULGU|nr:unnamed protein product [Gulo gulo]
MPETDGLSQANSVTQVGLPPKPTPLTGLLCGSQKESS